MTICYRTDMTTEPIQSANGITGRDAATIVRSVERQVASGALAPGDRVPSVRGLARQLRLSPSTVATAYRDLRLRGVLVSHDRSRTVVAHPRGSTGRLASPLPAGGVDLASGNPDPALLAELSAHLGELELEPVRYGDEPDLPALTELAARSFAADGLPHHHLGVCSGGLDAIERVLDVHLRPGDRVAVDDPGYIGTLDLIRTLGLEPVAVAVDDQGPLPDALEQALADGISGFVTTPRGQNPTGAVLTPTRAAQLQELLAPAPEVVVVEDDHLGLLGGPTPATLTTARARWTVVRSLSKPLAPDLRTAVVTGDAGTLAAVRARQRVGAGWVSHLLQRLAARCWTQALATGALTHARTTYATRRDALLAALAAEGVAGHGVSGLNVWVPVDEEAPVVQGLTAAGWAVQAGEPFRVASPPGVRITTAALEPSEAPALASALAAVLAHRLPTRRG